MLCLQDWVLGRPDMPVKYTVSLFIYHTTKLNISTISPLASGHPITFLYPVGDGNLDIACEYRSVCPYLIDWTDIIDHCLMAVLPSTLVLATP